MRSLGSVVVVIGIVVGICLWGFVRYDDNIYGLSCLMLPS